MAQEILHKTDHVMSGRMDHGMPGMPEDRCSMNMVFTWDWKNTCIVFKWWHIRTFSGFAISLIAIVVLGMGYEFIKNWFANWEKKNMATFVITNNNNTGSTFQKRFKFEQSLVYGVQVFYSFWLMLVFMTYNGWYMLAVALGAAIGNYFWGVSSDSVAGTARNMSCH
ncbi:CTR2 [Candida oxycetoniae]|uniref:Copper transport protein n=1 Tax=Candida oxycetoniae TaxID=497107 RepID=A0AAI9WZW0_9ASCO|nr:CTR2 [Candida oxycetoniae]KAI3406787.1 CTR2 [Candida oxycetoniae]